MHILRCSWKRLLLAASAMPFILLFLILESEPTVGETILINSERAMLTKETGKRFLREMLGGERGGAITLSATDEDISGLLALSERGVKRLRGKASISDSGLALALSLDIPRLPYLKYLNVGATLEPSASGMSLSCVKIGDLHLPGWFSIFAAKTAMNIALGDWNGSVLFNAVDSVNIENRTVSMRINPIHDILERKERLKKRFKFLRDSDPVADPEAISACYARILEAEAGYTWGKVSLSLPMKNVFELARSRSRGSGDFAGENKAAILALAIYAGNWRFERFTGPVRTAEMNRRRINLEDMTLRGRSDLNRHFMVSAGLKVLSNSGITNALGEFKELLDSNQGGSGFSFIDLAADMAGERFASLATDNQDSARNIQAIMSENADEGLFMPDISGLSENIRKEDFERTYGNVEDMRYKRVVDEINSRISRLWVSSQKI